MAISTVKVWNDNYLPYQEDFEDKSLRIEANRFILMDHEKAIKFLGTISAYSTDAGGVQKPETYKKLRIERLESTKQLGDLQKHKCQACMFIGKDAKDLDDHITEYHATQLLDKKEWQKRNKAS
jgi:hypothetical protein